jgi:hypothetical protein
LAYTLKIGKYQIEFNCISLKAEKLPKAIFTLKP